MKIGVFPGGCRPTFSEPFFYALVSPSGSKVDRPIGECHLPETFQILSPLTGPPSPLSYNKHERGSLGPFGETHAAGVHRRQGYGAGGGSLCASQAPTDGLQKEILFLFFPGEDYGYLGVPNS